MLVPTYQTMWYHNSEQHNLVALPRIFIHANCTQNNVYTYNYLPNYKAYLHMRQPPLKIFTFQENTYTEHV